MRMKRLFILTVILIVVLCFLYTQNNWIKVTNISLKFEALPEGFNSFRIVQLSDLHSKMFGNNQQPLVSKINAADPDIILFTGDLVNSSNYMEQSSLKLIDEIVSIAPVYYVTGNHEFWSGNFSSLEKKLQERGVKILRNKSEIIERNGSKISIIGIDDPAADSIQQYNSDESIVDSELQRTLKESDSQNFKILLTHRPELLPTYSKYNIDLVFSGHAHGGQVRLPFIGGIVAPNQGFLPKYTSGKYKEGHSVMIVNRGLGNSIIPQRLFNRPEIIVVSMW